MPRSVKRSQKSLKNIVFSRKSQNSFFPPPPPPRATSPSKEMTDLKIRENVGYYLSPFPPGSLQTVGLKADDNPSVPHTGGVRGK